MPEPERSSEINKGNDRSGGESSPPGGRVLGVVLTPVTMIAAGIAALVSELWHDKALASFMRQGIHELGTAVSKPFPDSIQVDEVGSIWNPPYAERGDSRDQGLVRRSSLLPPPGWAAEQTGQDKGNSQDQGMSM